jgi:hypothetical protein
LFKEIPRAAVERLAQHLEDLQRGVVVAALHSVQRRVTETESLRHVLLGQVCVLPEPSQAIGQPVGKVHAQKAWRKPISFMKSLRASDQVCISGRAGRLGRHDAHALRGTRRGEVASSAGCAATDTDGCASPRNERDRSVRGPGVSLLGTYHQDLGLREVHRFQNQLLDGALVLTNGARVVLEGLWRAAVLSAILPQPAETREPYVARKTLLIS